MYHGGNTPVIQTSRYVDSLKQPQLLIESLPDEILLLIFQNLVMFDLFAASQVNRRWCMLNADPFVWRSVTFRLEQSISVSLSLMHDKHQDPRQLLSKFHRKRGVTVWQWQHLQQHNRALFTVFWNIPSSSFLYANIPCSTSGRRFQAIQRLSLRGAGDILTDFFLREHLLPLLPQLRRVDLTGCYMIGDLSIRDLLLDFDRGRYLQELRLAKCFGLSGRCLRWLALCCRQLTVLDLGDGCGACQDQGLLELLTPTRNRRLHLNGHASASMEDEGDEEDEMWSQLEGQLNGRSASHLSRTLETLILSGADFVSGPELCMFLQELTSIPPSESRLTMLDLSNTFAINRQVLHHVYSTISQPLSRNPSQKSKRTFTLNLKQCDQLVKADVQELVLRLQQAEGGWKQVRVEDTCKIQDESYESLKSYLLSMQPVGDFQHHRLPITAAGST